MTGVLMRAAASSTCRAHAAELLDVVKTGTARVRVTYIGRADLEGGAPPPPETPPEIASALPAAPDRPGRDRWPRHRAGRTRRAARHSRDACRAPAPHRRAKIAANQPTGQVTKVPVPAATHLYVQVGAFSKLENAKTLLAKAGRGSAYFDPSTRRPDAL